MWFTILAYPTTLNKPRRSLMSSKYIYNDPIAKSMGLKPIQEYYPDYDFDFRPDHIPLWEQRSGEFNSFYGKKHTEETKKLYSETRQGENNNMYGRSAITEQQLRWYTDGTKNIYVTEDTQPDGFRRGRSNMKRKSPSKETRAKISNSLKARKSLSSS